MQAPPATEWTTVAKEVAGTVYLVSNLDSTHDYRFRVRARTLYGKVFDPSPIASVYRTIIAGRFLGCRVRACTQYGKVFDPSPIASVYRTIIAGRFLRCRFRV